MMNSQSTCNHFIMHVSQITILYTLNLHSDVCQLYLSETGSKKFFRGKRLSLIIKFILLPQNYAKCEKRDSQAIYNMITSIQFFKRQNCRHVNQTSGGLKEKENIISFKNLASLHHPLTSYPCPHLPCHGFNINLR